MNIEKLSKQLAYMTRHAPESIGCDRDPQGWLPVSIVCSALGIPVETIVEIINIDAKGRYELDDSRSRVRAVQGHSYPVDSGYVTSTPPSVLYHGTATRFLDSIREQGLTKRSRTFVHLSNDVETAVNVGKRYGEPVVLVVDAGRMSKDDYVFHLASNGVWLTDSVPVEYIDFGGRK